MSDKAIVLDANILIRAVLGQRVRELILNNASTVKFFAPDVAYADARKYCLSMLKYSGSGTQHIENVADGSNYREPHDFTFAQVPLLSCNFFSDLRF